jgi:glyoxylase-like metal-dependent hydrolase (beta-lactamase superfamily II)
MYQVDVLVQGYPGRAVCHGGLGWSTITLLRGCGRVVLVDVGAFGIRKELARQLRARAVAPEAVTDVVLTHAHYDHAVNFTLFPQATVWIGEDELAWASSQPPGFDPLPELYVQSLAHSPRVRRLRHGDQPVPFLTALAAPGHTPGHLLFHLEPDGGTPLLFTGDAAKNRAELMSLDVDATCDHPASIRSLELIWRCWRQTAGTVLVPGHDLCMTLDEHGVPRYIGERRAAIAAWFSEDLALMSTVDLCSRHQT